jgi:hypothetical protein
MRSITFHTCPCGYYSQDPRGNNLCECPNTGKNVLLVELSYNDYNYFVNKLKYDQRLMKSYEYYQSKYQINFVYLEDHGDAFDIDDTLIESFINLNL